MATEALYWADDEFIQRGMSASPGFAETVAKTIADDMTAASTSLHGCTLAEMMDLYEQRIWAMRHREKLWKTGGSVN